jgi:hypothetical protein
MGLKGAVKRMLLGEPGMRPREIRRGLLKGLRFNIDTGSKGMRLLGLDEREIAADTRRFAEQAHFALDIGANDGWYTTYFASLPNIAGVIACEPGDGLHDSVRANIALNETIPPGKVELIRKFVSDRDDDQNVTLDSMRPKFQSPLLIKLDVDGGETAVLRGARETLRDLDCLLVVETHSPELERDCIAMLREVGYTSRVIDHGWYRVFVPEHRVSAHNRWFVAAKRPV